MAEDAPRPHVQRFAEALCAILSLHRGRRRLELVFEDGRLVEWSVAHDRAPVELAEYEEDGAWLVERRETVSGPAVSEAA